jgi:carbon monoxide dehydrogenase subunit G
MPDIEQSFTIDQPIERVWDFFQDVPQVVTCMPGLEFTGSTGAASYGGKVRVKLGPIAAAFQGEATIVETDAAQRRARLEAKGIDRQGGNRAQASVTYELTPAGTGTAVRLYGDIKLAGALAQMGRSGIVQDVAAELTRQFAETLRAKLAAGAGAAGAPAATRALGGGRLLWQLVWHRVRSLFARLFRA